ncbi:MAG: Crp/Fnr family transcriptional regulator [Ruminococcus sp.]|jgi:CRP/FNR family transcriptional regulator
MLEQAMIFRLKQGLPFWEKLTEDEKKDVEKNSQVLSFGKGVTIHRTDEKCMGVMLLLEGQIRAYVLSEDGREVTLYRLFPDDLCVLSASCVLDAVAFDVQIEAVENSRVILIPISYFKTLMDQNVYVEMYTYKASTERFSDVMWTLQQILFMRADQRLAVFLWDEITKSGKDTVCYTHDQIARYIGSAREVVSRILKYFEQEKAVVLSRGKIQILDRKKLKSYL